MQDGLGQEGVGDLTEKEKETLRLLLSGHDTKSTASTLGLSVYTINDRLRSARRKLGVTSSREAARILGEAEGGVPQFPAPPQSGMGEGGDAAPLSGQSKPARLSTRTLALLAGGIAMIALITAAAMLALSPISEVPATEASLQSDDDKEVAANDARRAEVALEWLALVDAEEWEESWQQAGAFFRSEVTAAQWEEAIRPVRDPLGAVQSREVVSVQQTSKLPGVPEDDYVVLQFTTAFANAAESVETVIMQDEDEGLKTVGYFVR